MFVLSSTSSGSEVRSVNHASIYQKTELKVFENIEFLDKTSNKWPIWNKCIQGSWVLLTMMFDNIAMD